MEQSIINFYSETDFLLDDQEKYNSWIGEVISSENRKQGEISYIFCDDYYLLDLNKEYLDHDTFTDIISFDYSVGKIVQGDIFISIDRVKENSVLFNVSFQEELRRVIIHGILHLCGYKDKSSEESELMREKEEEKMKLFHVEQ